MEAARLAEASRVANCKVRTGKPSRRVQPRLGRPGQGRIRLQHKDLRGAQRPQGAYCSSSGTGKNGILGCSHWRFSCLCFALLFASLPEGNLT
ncbi:hypothetical protein N658DRAFT_34469 [Parathielavia hyrcaniae]|uniref:Uncharacterized protein n=1 Tax=Parathielavia hyrcaniae TaxID=113614 RepID=A0AAN6T7L5_9PEZI|nr:hypothetical protein N658DRAFT_34469 [Parathielavia hyrcaniae]